MRNVVATRSIAVQVETKTSSTSDVNMEEEQQRPSPQFDLIRDTIGNIGRYQIYVCCCTSLVKIVVAMHLMGIVFIAPSVDFWCKRPQGLETMDINQWKNMSQPVSKHARFAACKIYDRNYTQNLYTGADSTTHDKLRECREWEYDTSEFSSTIIMDWDLVCNKFELVDVAQSVYMFGVLVGSLLFGMLADKYGRKVTLLMTIVIQIIGGVGASFTPWFELLLALRFLNAAAGGGQLVVSFVICMEIVAGKWRTIISALYHVPFSLGISALAVVSYFIRDWRYNQLAISLPPVLLLSFWWLIPESPRWLLAVGREDEAISILEKGAKYNRMDSSQIFNLIHSYNKQNNLNKKEVEKKATVVDLLRTPNIRLKTLCIIVSWTACGICFYGLHQYVGQIGNIFLNVAISGLIEIPGFTISMYFMDRFGRRNTLMGSQLLSAISCLLIIAVIQGASELEWPRVMLACVGIIGISLAFASVYVYSGELFPTVVRNAGLGLGSMFARIGAMVAPFILSLKVYSSVYPALLFGLLPLAGSLLCFLLPETLNAVLPTTIEEGENFGKKSKRSKEGVVNQSFVIEDLSQRT